MESVSDMFTGPHFMHAYMLNIDTSMYMLYVIYIRIDGIYIYIYIYIYICVFSS